MLLTVTEKLRTDRAAERGDNAPVFGRLEFGGEICATFYQRTPAGPVSLTSLTREQADMLAARLADLGRPVPGVSADHGTATAFVRGMAAAHRRGADTQQADSSLPSRYDHPT